MTPPSLLGVLGVLCLVLGLVVLAAWALRRLGVGAAGRGSTALEVEARAALAPRQGVATVRVGGRRVLVSYGEGGVRTLLDLGAESVGAAAGSGADAGRGEPDLEFPVSEGAGHAAPRLRPLPARNPASDDGISRPLDASPLRLPFRETLNRVAQARAFRTLLGVAVLAAGLGWPTTVAAAGTISAPGAVVATVAQTAPRTPTVRAPSAPGATAPAAPQVQVSVGGAASGPLEVSGPVGTVLFIGFMTVLPTLLLLMTGFTRILIVLHLLKQALGTQTAPPGHLLAALALLLTGFVMAPTFETVHERAVRPWMDGEMDEVAMLKEASVPMRSFMLEATREQDLAAFVEMREGPRPSTIDEIPLVVVTSAFVTSELTSAFQMGFALFLPFVVIDLVVASVLMSMGMFMLPPVMVSLPFKLLLFVMVDGWSLVLGSLVRSF